MTVEEVQEVKSWAAAKRNQDPLDPEYSVILTEADLDEMVRDYLATDGWAFDVETVGEKSRVDPRINHVLWISFASETRTDVIPMGHPNGELLDIEYPMIKKGIDRRSKGLKPLQSDYSQDIKKATRHFSPPPEQLSRSYVMEALMPLFRSDAVKIGHNVKFDITSVSKYLSEPIAGPFFDTRTVQWVEESSLSGQLGLAESVKRHLGLAMEKGVGAKVEIHTFDDVAQYSAIDARATFDLQQSIQNRLRGKVSDHIWKVFDLEMATLEVLAEMDMAGVRIDKEALKELDKFFADRITVSEAEVYKRAGRRFRINSVPQKQSILYGTKTNGGQGLRPKVMTSSGQKRADAGETPTVEFFSTSSDALKPHAKNKVVKALTEYQKFKKLRGTYVTPYLGGVKDKYVGGKTVEEDVTSKLHQGRIYTTFVADRTETGRMSSREPNLQNIPSRSAEGMKIREVFVPSEGHVFVQADYSQIEPRIIADLSDEKVMLETYRDGGDVYQMIADRMKITRNAGKTLVLGIAYGIGSKSIAEQINVSVREADDLTSFFARSFPRIPRLKEAVLIRARSDGYSQTVLGRRRYLPDIKVSDNYLRTRAQRQAFNHVCQGSAADVMKLGLVKVHKSLPDYAKMLLTIHDEIVTETPIGTEDEVLEILVGEMEAAGKALFKIPLVAEGKIANNWSECK